MLRKLQAEFNDVIQGIISGSRVSSVYIHATPGAGKSAIPIIAGELIRAGLVNKLAWIVPRLTLGYQAETNFIDPFFRDLLNHDLTIRASTNQPNPSRGQDGFVSTYQAVGLDEKRTISRDFSSKKYVLVADEFHHCEQNGVWHKAMQPLVDKAPFSVYMTGTLARGDDQKIAWVPYEEGVKGLAPIMKSTETRAVIRYTRADALRERAILPLTFSLYDGHVEYKDVSGKKVSVDLSESYKETGAAIYTALNTEFADQLLAEGLDHWSKYKLTHPRSKAIIVTSDILHARRVLAQVTTWGFAAKIAVSDDSPSAHRAIKEFKGWSGLDLLVGVGMFYEGFDCKPLSHVIALTHIRSVPWIEQMVARSVRVDPYGGPYDSQAGYIFAPDDPLFRRAVTHIQKEQLQFVKEPGEKREKHSNNGEKIPDIIPLGGEVTGHREISFGVDLGQGPPSDYAEEEVFTVSDQEGKIRSIIDKHIREYSHSNYYKPQRINSELKEHFNDKPRADMDLQELRECLTFIENYYPLDRRGVIEKKAGISSPRGQGRRVPTKAQPWQIPMF